MDGSPVETPDTASVVEIKNVMAEYNVAGDRGRLDALCACFTEDGTLLTPLWSATGWADMAQALGSNASMGTRRPGFVRHHLTTSAIVVEPGGKATGRSYFMVMTDIGVDHAGVYVDTFRHTPRGWRIARREVRIDWKADNSYFEKQRVGRDANQSS